MKKIARMALVLAVSTGMVLGVTPANALSSGGFSTGVTAPSPVIGYYGDEVKDTESVEQELTRLINQHRVNNGVPAAQVTPALMESAKSWSNTMSQSKRLYHSGLNVAENIATSSRQENAQTLFEVWKNSPPHNHNMLDPRLKTLGVGVVYDMHGNTWATTQLFFR